MSRRDQLVLHLTGALITIVILAPLAVPGYVLRYDMNFVPAQGFQLDLIAPLSAAPRAVPLDAAVSLVNTVMPGWLLQRLVLAAIIWAAVVGAGRLVPTESLTVRLIAAVGYGWTPFLAERLLIGQWGLLIAYAAMPWLVMAALKRDLPRLTIAAGLCALTPTGGILAALVALTLRPTRKAVAVVLLVNLPWLTASLLSETSGRSDPAGVEAFAARAENWGGALFSLAGTGGIWNSETTPASRASPLIPLLTLVLLGLALYGYPKMPRGLWISAAVGFVLAALPTIQSGAWLMRTLIEHVPGAGLLRDSQKFILPYALLLVVCVALGAQRLAARLPTEAGRAVLIGGLILLVAPMPDLAYGGAGALKPVQYPAGWAKVADLVGADPGTVLSLPLSEYRRYAWNHDTVVLDPAPRYLPAPVITDDTLIVDGKPIAGEDPRVAEIRAQLSDGDLGSNRQIRWVLVQAPSPEGIPGLDPVYSDENLALYRNPHATVSNVGSARQWAIVVAELVALLTLMLAAATIALKARR